MMHMDIKVDGLDRLRRNLDKSASILDAELRPAIRAGGDLLRAEAKSLAVGNKLPASVQMKSLAGGLSVIVGSAARTALSIEMGRPVGDMPSVSLITAWMGRKGITAEVEGARVSLKSGRVLGVGKSKRGQQIGRAQRDLAWKIAISIREHGTKALPFIIPAARHKKDQVNRLVNEAVGRAMHRVAKG